MKQQKKQQETLVEVAQRTDLLLTTALRILSTIATIALITIVIYAFTKMAVTVMLL